MTEADGTSNDAAQNGEKKNDVSNELTDKVVKQIEFYFGDSNMPRDKFMLEQIKLDDGWIPLSTMFKFQRLAKLTTDPDIVVNALKRSDLMEVKTDGDEVKIRRSPDNPLPELNEERRKEIANRTIYAKGFPLDSTLDSVMTVLEPYGPVDNIIMRKYKDSVAQKKMFKGSIFATFPSKEKAQAFIDTPSIKANETELLRLWMLDYNEKKKKEHSKDKKPKKELEVEPITKSLKKGSVIKLTGEFNPATNREDIKSALTSLEIDIAYIGFNKGDDAAFLRLHEENSAKGALEKMENGLTVLDVKLQAQAMEGEEEEEFLKKALEDRKKFAKGSSRRGGRKGRGRGAKRDSGEDRGPPAKRRAVE